MSHFLVSIKQILSTVNINKSMGIYINLNSTVYSKNLKTSDYSLNVCLICKRSLRTKVLQTALGAVFTKLLSLRKISNFKNADFSSFTNAFSLKLWIIMKNVSMYSFIEENLKIKWIYAYEIFTLVWDFP